MILTQKQKAARERAILYINLLGPIPCPDCGGSMMMEVQADVVGWACILCSREKMWNIPDGDGFKHLRPDEPHKARLPRGSSDG